MWQYLINPLESGEMQTLETEEGNLYDFRHESKIIFNLGNTSAIQFKIFFSFPCPI
jgi:hypothetical protein